MLSFITLIRGAHVFAPYQGLSRSPAGPPSPGKPHRPLLRDDPDHIRQVAAAFATALLDGQPSKPGRLSESVLNHPAAHPSPGRDLIDASGTLAMLANLIAD